VKKIFVIVITAFLFAINAGNLEYTYAAQHSVNFSLPLKFKWGHGGLVRGQKYKIKLKALQKNTPMPGKSQKEEYIERVKEGETKEIFPSITYTSPGDYKYELELIRGRNKVLKKYYLHIQVLNQGNGELFVTTAIHKNTQAGAKVTEIRFMDLVDDENLYDKDHNSNSEHNKNERCDEYLNEKNKNRSDSGTKTKTSESSKAKSRTGDDKKVEMYLWMSIISLGILLVIGCKKISGRR
jgi:hypothetical protein